MDKHDISTASKIYAALTPAQDAKLAKHCFLKIMGQPIEFPSHCEWLARGRSLHEIIRRRSTSSAEGDPAEPDADLLDMVCSSDDECMDDWVELADAGKDDEHVDSPCPKQQATPTHARPMHSHEPTAASSVMAPSTVDDAAPTISDADLTVVQSHTRIQRKQVFADSEKVFLVHELRKAQSSPSSIPSKEHIELIIQLGFATGRLTQPADYDPQKYLEQARNFLRQFVKRLDTAVVVEID